MVNDLTLPVMGKVSKEDVFKDYYLDEFSMLKHEWENLVLQQHRSKLIDKKKEKSELLIESMRNQIEILRKKLGYK